MTDAVEGNLDEAIAASRKAAALWPDSFEPSLWEGIAQARAGRSQKAQRALKNFLSAAAKAPLALRNKAEQYLKT